MTPTTARAARALPRLTDGVDGALTHTVPEGICRTFRLVPYARHDAYVLVAAVEADDAFTEHVLAERLDRPVLLVRHTAHEIAAVLDRTYPPAATPAESPEERRARTQMAHLLTRSGLVDAEQLHRAMLEHASTGDPLGDVLVAQGALPEDVLVAALSEIHQLERVALAGSEPDPDVARLLSEPVARRLRAIPVGEAGDELLLAVARPLRLEDVVDLEHLLGRPVRQLLANRSDLDQLQQRVHSSHHTDVATHHLRESDPDLSAHVVVSAAQRACFVAALVVLLIGGALYPRESAVVLVTAGSALSLLVAAYRSRLVLRALGGRLGSVIDADDVAGLDERTLPVCTILVPLHDQAAEVPGLVRAVDALDYPRTRLDVQLLCEADDVATLDAVRRLDLPPHYRLVVVPDSQPRSRPKALDHGLQLAAGEHTVVYDAEDRPEPDQLKKAVLALERADDDVVCVQAALHHRETDDTGDTGDTGRTLLAAWAATEHAVQSDLVLPALAAAGAPVPLGASSSHVVTARLRELGGWDPHNATEGADLGVRLHRRGYRAEVLDSTTRQRGGADLGAWVQERSRWATGAFQTWLVHVRHPLTLLRETGLRGFLGFQLSAGAAFVLLLDPLFWALTTLAVLTRSADIDGAVPPAVTWAAGVTLVVGNAVAVHLALAASLHRGAFGSARTAVLSPLFRALLSWAAWTGFVRLFTHPAHGDRARPHLDGGVLP